jgi:hypothetical protein
MRYLIFRRQGEESGFHSLEDSVTDVGRVDSWISQSI